MITVKTLAEAYQHFVPYNPRRPAETVVICSGGFVTFLHWDPFPAEFTVENGADRQAFSGWHIDRMAQEAERSTPVTRNKVTPAHEASFALIAHGNDKGQKTNIYKFTPASPVAVTIKAVDIS